MKPTRSVSIFSPILVPSLARILGNSEIDDHTYVAYGSRLVIVGALPTQWDDFAHVSELLG